VVGGSSGIGAAIADECRARGHAVLTAQRREPQAPGEWVPLDLRWSIDTIRGAIDECHRRLGRIDWLVIAGGTGAYMRPLFGKKDLEVHASQASEQIATNLLGPAFVFEAAAQHLMRTDGEPTSRVLYIGSTIVRQPPKALAYYAASKAGAEAFFRSEARRWASHGVRVNVLATGWIHSPMTREIDQRIVDKILRATATGRMGSAQEAAEMALSILDGPDFICGDVIPMSGGI
jgi:3-oxoacyl-[acyl-carrier protein] reductase